MEGKMSDELSSGAMKTHFIMARERALTMDTATTQIRSNTRLQEKNPLRISLLSVAKTHIHFAYPPLESKHAMIRRQLKSWGFLISSPLAVFPGGGQ
jgi:hypothetical protein